MKHTHICTYLCLLGLVVMLAATTSASAATITKPRSETPEKKVVTAFQILEEAKKHIGKPYRWGGKGPNAFDCAGFVRFVYGKFGYQLAGSAGSQYQQGQPLTEAELEPGDLVFYGGRGSSRSIGHVGIVTQVNDDGSFYFIHAARTGVRISHSSERYYDMRYICACRILNAIIDNSGNGTNLDDIDGLFDESEKVYAFMRGLDITNKLDVRLVQIDPDPEPDTLDLAFVGGIMSRKCNLLGKMSCLPMPNDYENILHQTNVTVGVLNGPLSDSGNKLAKRFSSRRKHQMTSSCAMDIMYSGINMISLAGHHTSDLGVKGIKETMSALDSVGIRYTGIRHGCHTTVLERNGYWYGYCSFGHSGESLNYLDASEVKDVIQSLRDTVDILIVNFVPVSASKVQDSNVYESTLQRFARNAVDFGADVVVGCSTSDKKCELYNGRFIYYSLGDFCHEGQKDAEVLRVKILSNGTYVDASKYVLPMDDSNTMTETHLKPIKRSSKW